jgi:hypothetical protein
MANPLTLPTDPSPTQDNFTAQGGHAAPPAVTLPPDSTGPPIVPGLTKISPSRIVDVMKAKARGQRPSSESPMGQVQLDTPADILKFGGLLAGKAMEMGPDILDTLAIFFKSINKKVQRTATGQMDMEAVVGRTRPPSFELEPLDEMGQTPSPTGLQRILGG